MHICVCVCVRVCMNMCVRVCRYDWPKDEWSSICSMSKKRCGVGLAAVGRYLYAMGGHDGTHYLNSIERLVNSQK